MKKLAVVTGANRGLGLETCNQLLQKDIKVETLHKTIGTNAFGTFLLCQKLIPLMKNRNYGRGVNLSSQQGEISPNMLGDTY